MWPCRPTSLNFIVFVPFGNSLNFNDFCPNWKSSHLSLYSNFHLCRSLLFFLALEIVHSALMPTFVSGTHFLSSNFHFSNVQKAIYILSSEL